MCLAVATALAECCTFDRSADQVEFRDRKYLKVDDDWRSITRAAPFTSGEPVTDLCGSVTDCRVHGRTGAAVDALPLRDAFINDAVPGQHVRDDWIWKYMPSMEMPAGTGHVLMAREDGGDGICVYWSAGVSWAPI